jgi:hypothetical protein
MDQDHRGRTWTPGKQANVTNAAPATDTMKEAAGSQRRGLEQVIIDHLMDVAIDVTIIISASGADVVTNTTSSH